MTLCLGFFRYLYAFGADGGVIKDPNLCLIGVLIPVLPHDDVSEKNPESSGLSKVPFIWIYFNCFLLSAKRVKTEVNPFLTSGDSAGLAVANREFPSFLFYNNFSRA